MDNYKKLSDIELIELAKNGDQSAFAQIYERYWSILFLHAKKMFRYEEEAKDVVQNLFLNLYRDIGKIDFRISLSAYLYRSVKNMVLDHIKHEKVVDRYLESFNDFLKHGTLCTDEEIRRRELEKIIEDGISLLPEKMREVFLLSRKHNLSHKEIQEKLGITQHTIKSQISNAIRILRIRIGSAIILVLF